MFSPFQNLLHGAAAKFGFTRQMKAIQICQEYRELAEKLLPQDALTHTFPKSYDNRTLTIGVFSSVWAQQLAMHKHLILEAINQKFGEDTVKKVNISLCEPEQVI